MGTERGLDQQAGNNCDDSVTKVTEELAISRRKFTRNALVGSAVLLTLSNRSAWGWSHGNKILVCASASLLESYNTANPSRLTIDEQTEIETYNSYYSKRIADPVLIDGDKCYEVKIETSQHDRFSPMY